MVERTKRKKSSNIDATEQGLTTAANRLADAFAHTDCARLQKELHNIPELSREDVMRAMLLLGGEAKDANIFFHLDEDLKKDWNNPPVTTISLSRTRQSPLSRSHARQSPPDLDVPFLLAPVVSRLPVAALAVSRSPVTPSGFASPSSSRHLALASRHRGTGCAASSPHPCRRLVTLSLQLSRSPVATALPFLSASSGVGDCLELHSPHSVAAQRTTTWSGRASPAIHHLARSLACVCPFISLLSM
ncbi:hypothetical protein Syun_028991 [Stephania yunnanensis]|uniref:Uncharacterized protein n=1 Tax=Stephania yunnanensis TaxID=152371 RepID=A0AAP0E945_9MAGN